MQIVANLALVSPHHGGVMFDLAFDQDSILLNLVRDLDTSKVTQPNVRSSQRLYLVGYGRRGKGGFQKGFL